jgi:hypothetical protein
MRKHMLLSLLIVSTAFVHAMESDSWFSSFFSLRSYLPAWFSSHQMPSESKLISDLRASKSKFESQLQTQKWKNQPTTSVSLLTFFIKSLDVSPVEFLQYCYYQIFHKFKVGMYLERLKATSSLKKFQEAQIEGCSALGAAMIAESISIEEKRNFIQELISRNFKPTPKDIELEELILYDEIAKQQEKILHFLRASSAYWFVLPQEIRKQIIGNMIDLFKNEVWLLPEKSLSEL